MVRASEVGSPQSATGKKPSESAQRNWKKAKQKENTRGLQAP